MVAIILPGRSGPMIGGGTGAGGADSAAYTNFIARTSGLDGTHLAAYKTLLDGLTTDGFFDGAGASSFLDGLYIWATQDSTTALLNLVKNAFNGTTSGTITFSADHGYTGNGSTGYIDTGFTPSTATTPNWVQNSASLGGYVLTSRTTSVAYAIAGNSQSASTTFDFLISRYSNGNAFTNINNGASNINVANANAQGQYIGTRTSSSQIDLYRNGNTTPIATSGALTSNTVADHSLLFFARRNTSAGQVAEFNADQMSAGFWGKGLTSAQMAIIAGRINSYMTSFGINVY